LFTITASHTNVNVIIPFCIVCLQQAKISFPFVADNLSTCKASNWNDHPYDISQETVLNTHDYTIEPNRYCIKNYL